MFCLWSRAWVRISLVVDEEPACLALIGTISFANWQPPEAAFPGCPQVMVWINRVCYVSYLYQCFVSHQYHLHICCNFYIKKMNQESD
eukprot:Gb_05229 [translate_table: standard]